MNNEREKALVRFYLKECCDDKGRSLDEIWSWDLDKLEITHDYIQWLFPLTEKSSFNLCAPVFDNEQIAIFKSNSEIKTNILISLKVMMKFYGLESTEDGNKSLIFKRSYNYQDRKTSWQNIGNHNYLRITRILKCLTLVELNIYANAIYELLKDIYNNEAKELIGRDSFNYWTIAVTL